MSDAAVQAFLARLYVDDALRARFLADPSAEARRAGLDDAETAALAAIDREGLALAARSYAAKREACRRGAKDGGKGPRTGLAVLLSRALRRLVAR